MKKGEGSRREERMTNRETHTKTQRHEEERTSTNYNIWYIFVNQLLYIFEQSSLKMKKMIQSQMKIWMLSKCNQVFVSLCLCVINSRENITRHIFASLREKFRNKPYRFVKFSFFIFHFSLLIFSLLIFPLAAETLDLDQALKTLGGNVEFRWDPFFSSGAIIDGQHQAAFFSGKAGESGAVLLDHRDVLTLPLPFMDGGNLKFPEAFISQVKSTFSRYYEEDQSRFRIAAIIIDPGHGGKDPGALGEHKVGGRILKSIEKDITLKVSRLLYSTLAAAFPDKQVLLTRSGDSYPTLEDRVTLANAVPLTGNEAAIYVSIHANYSFNKNARGYELWYLSPGYRRDLIDGSQYSDSMPEYRQEVLPILNSMLEEELTTESILLANSILKRMGEAVGSQIPSRGLKAEEWFVVRNTRMPAVLIELGFVSNETDALLMDDDAYLKKLSDALYKGIGDFIAFFERSGGFTVLQ